MASVDPAVLLFRDVGAFPSLGFPSGCLLVGAPGRALLKGGACDGITVMSVRSIVYPFHYLNHVSYARSVMFVSSVISSLCRFGRFVSAGCVTNGSSG